MMGRQEGDQGQLFYLFNLERRIPADHLLRRINQVMVDIREKLAPFYSEIGRPSIDPELLIRMLIVGYLEDAERLIDAWNERQAKRMPMLFSNDAPPSQRAIGFSGFAARPAAPRMRLTCARSIVTATRP
jgi:hypothetical protein